MPGTRVTRMSALEGTPGSSPGQGLRGGIGGQTDGADTSPESQGPVGAEGAPSLPKREKHLGELDGSSPESGGYSSGENGNAARSEQMDAFKDYYSTDEVHPNDMVSVLWAYQPRANDEFELERGDMLRIVGIWDDGWATGVRINQRAETWEEGRQAHRDSGLSGSSRVDESPPQNGDVKAFPVSFCWILIHQ